MLHNRNMKLHSCAIFQTFLTITNFFHKQGAKQHWNKIFSSFSLRTYPFTVSWINFNGAKHKRLLTFVAVFRSNHFFTVC